MSDFFKVPVSETARARVAADYGYLPADAAEVAAGYLTLIETVAERYRPASMQAEDFATATSIMEGCRMSPAEMYRRRREYMEDVEPYLRAFARFLALYPRPVFIPVSGVKL